MKTKMMKTMPLVLGLCFSLEAQALVLGDLHVASYLGQRLSGSISVSGDDLERLGPECFVPVQPGSEANQGLPWIPRYDISLRKDKEGGRLVLTTGKTLDEPLLTLGLKVGCGVDVVRDYVLLLSPQPEAPVPVVLSRTEPVVAPVALQEASPTPEVAPPKPVAKPAKKPARKPQPRQAPPVRSHTWVIGEGESVQSLAASLYPDNAKMRRAFTRAVYQANPDLALDYSSRDPLPSGMSLAIPDLRDLANSPVATAPAVPVPAPPAAPGTASPAAKASPEAAEKAPEKPAEKPASEGSGKPQEKTQEKPPETPKHAASGDRLVIGADPADEIYPGDEAFHARVMHTQSEMQQLGQFMEKRLQAGEAPAEDRAILELQTRLVTLQLALEKIKATEKLLAAQNEAAAAVAAARANTLAQAPGSVPAPLTQMEAPAAGDGGVKWWELLLLGGGMGAVGVGLGAWLGRRREKAASAWQRDLDWAAGNVSGHHAAAGPVADGAFANPKPSAGSGSAGEVSEEVQEARYHLPQVHELGQDDFAEFADLTDFMLATGRVESAAEFLREFVEAEPDKALTPWIKLLETYRQLGKEKEFRWVAHQLRLYFNVAEVRWEDDRESLSRVLGEQPGAAVDLGLPMSLEEMPHVCNTIIGLWGSPSCYKYLESLLRDNRGGQRQGFSLPVIQEIMFLMHLLQHEVYVEQRMI